jgi:hypothetical protein
MGITSTVTSETFRVVISFVCLAVLLLLGGYCVFKCCRTTSEETTEDISEVPTNVYKKRQDIFEELSDDGVQAKSNNTVYWV